MDANRVKLLPSSPRDGRGLAQLLTEALIEHDRQVSELRVELARMQGLRLSPAMALGGPMLRQDLAPGSQLPPAPVTPPPPVAPSPGAPIVKKDIEVQTLALVPAETRVVRLSLPSGRAEVAPDDSAAQQQGGGRAPTPASTSTVSPAATPRSPPMTAPLSSGGVGAPEARPAAAPKEQGEQGQPRALALSQLSESSRWSEEKVEDEDFAEDMRWASSLGQKAQKSPNLREKFHKHLWNEMELAATVLILVNTFFLAAQLQFTSYLAGSFLGVRSPGPFRDDSVKLLFDYIEIGFTVVFTIEFAARLVRNGCQIFYRTGHLEYVSMLDAVVVLTSIWDSFATNLLGVSSINPSFLRPLRFLRLLRLPSVRYGERFARLRLLMATIVRSTMSLFWSMFFLWSVMLFSAIFLCQCLADSLYDENIEESVRLWIYKHYGSVARSIYTIFQVTFSGSWPKYAEPLVEHVSSLWTVFFVMYVTFILFAVSRIISAFFIKDTLAVAAEDKSTAVKEAERKRAKFGAQMAALFQEADESGDGQLTLQELGVCVREERFEILLAAMGFSADECIELFEVLDAGRDGKVSAQEFVCGMVHVKEGVRAQDIMRISSACNLMVQDLHQQHQELKELLSRQTPQ